MSPFAWRRLQALTYQTTKSRGRRPNRLRLPDPGGRRDCQRGKNFHLILRRITRYKLSPTRSSQHLLDPPDLPCTIRTSRYSPGDEWSSAATKRFRRAQLGAKIPYSL